MYDRAIDDNGRAVELVIKRMELLNRLECGGVGICLSISLSPLLID